MHRPAVAEGSVGLVDIAVGLVGNSQAVEQIGSLDIVPAKVRIVLEQRALQGLDGSGQTGFLFLDLCLQLPTSHQRLAVRCRIAIPVGLRRIEQQPGLGRVSPPELGLGEQHTDIGPGIS